MPVLPRAARVRVGREDDSASSGPLLDRRKGVLGRWPRGHRRTPHGSTEPAAMTRYGCLVALVVLLGLGALFLGEMYERSLRHGSDLTIYLNAARALAHGQNPYATDVSRGFTAYPLTIAALTVPLTW